MDKDKFEFYLKKIEGMFPKKSKLNQRQYCEIKGICSTTFNDMINRNELSELPKFKSKKTIRKNGIVYRSYSFDIFDVAQFLAK
ncbi:hypothetical protein ACN9JV_06685 [Aliarcobacter butzleri]|uniref:hypothetical protein n=1 Tax=Aliarcobacter butzleri TaxID=28197 RepID=UPI003B212D68